MDSKKRVRVIIHVLLVIAVMAFIFSHSMANRAQSTSESMGVFEFLMKLLGTIGLGGGLTEHIVRKMAHFSEFAALGFFAAIVMRDIRIVRLPYVLNVFLFGILCAMTDETIQLFNDRSARVTDVWIDFCGAVCGCLIYFFVFLAAEQTYAPKDVKKRPEFRSFFHADLCPGNQHAER